jgi:hypothetical protein
MPTFRVAAIAALVVLPAGAAIAHDPYSDWVSGLGVSCCHRTDCGVWAAEDVDPRADGGAWIRSLGVEVVREKVLPSPDGKVHVCCVRENEEIDGPCKRLEDGKYMVRCVALPMGT